MSPPELIAHRGASRERPENTLAAFLRAVEVEADGIELDVHLTADGVLMVRAYGWAFADPIRKLWYNITVTAVSVLVAGLIGGIEALGLVADKFSPDGDLWKAVAGLNDMLGTLGVGAIAIFLVCWLVSALIYRWKRYELAPYRGAS